MTVNLSWIIINWFVESPEKKQNRKKINLLHTTRQLAEAWLKQFSYEFNVKNLKRIIDGKDLPRIVSSARLVWPKNKEQKENQFVACEYLRKNTKEYLERIIEVNLNRGIEVNGKMTVDRWLAALWPLTAILSPDPICWVRLDGIKGGKAYEVNSFCNCVNTVDTICLSYCAHSSPSVLCNEKFSERFVMGLSYAIAFVLPPLVASGLRRKDCSSMLRFPWVPAPKKRLCPSMLRFLQL